SYLCELGLPIYITQNAVHFDQEGIFANGSAGAPPGDTRTNGIIIGSCTDYITYSLNSLVSYPTMGGGDVFINANAAVTCDDISCDQVDFSTIILPPPLQPPIIIIPFTIPEDFCTGQSGPVVMHIGTALITEGACEEQVFAPNSPQTVAITI